jgi:glutamate synthase domain-containing protein 1
VWDIGKKQNPYSDDKLHDACGIFAMMSRSGRTFAGDIPITAMENMHDRGNGLGGGFAAYGIYPDWPELFAFHLMFETKEAKAETEKYLHQHFSSMDGEEIPTRPHPGITSAPILFRYFLRPNHHLLEGLSEDDFVVQRVMHINLKIDGAFVFSSGRNMGVFKAVGHTEDVGRFFKLDEYEAYCWTAHSRFPTNTTAWWGGAHPFSVLDWTVVHNGEISSYGTNRNYLEMQGYFCTMHTDTEVIAYAMDLLARRHGLPIEMVCKVMAPPLWKDIDQMAQADRDLYTTLRVIYGPLLMNGPFSIVMAHQGEMVALGDRIRLRPLVAAERDDVIYIASEEAPIRLVEPTLDRVWIPKGGEPVIVRLDDAAMAKAHPEGRQVLK